MNRESDIRGVYLPLATAEELAQAHAALGAGFRSGCLSPVVGHVFPLDQASKAHELILKSGAQGKIVLDCLKPSPSL